MQKYRTQVPFVLNDGHRAEVGDVVELEEDVARHFGPLVQPVLEVAVDEEQ